MSPALMQKAFLLDMKPMLLISGCHDFCAKVTTKKMQVKIPIGKICAYIKL
jgi:hypothetical protein